MAEKLSFYEACLPALYEYIWVGVFTLITTAIGAFLLLLYKSENLYFQYALVVIVTLFIVAFFWVALALRYHQKSLAQQPQPNPFETPEYDLSITPKNNERTTTPALQQKIKYERPVLVVEHTRIIMFHLQDNKEAVGKTAFSDSKAFIVDFTFRPTENSYPKISVKAKIEYQDIDKKRVDFVRTGYWLEEIDSSVHLTTGDTGSLMIALFYFGKLNSYEYSTQEHSNHSQTVLDKKIRQLEGKDFLINIELIVKQFGDSEAIMNPKHSFRISLKPELKFEEVKELLDS